MKNSIVIASFIGMTAMGVHAFDEYSDINLETPRERKIRRAYEKRDLERYSSHRHDPKAPSNIALKNFKKLQDPRRHTFGDFSVGGRYGEREYYYQKPGVDKQGEPYRRYVLNPNTVTQEEITAEIARRITYDEKQKQKINYWTRGIFGRWLYDRYGF